MPRYIDAEKIVNYEVTDENDNKFILLPIKHLYDIPAADVVEVVRCKDCINRDSFEYCKGREDDYYCATGKK